MNTISVKVNSASSRPAAARMSAKTLDSLLRMSIAKRREEGDETYKGLPVIIDDGIPFRTVEMDRYDETSSPTMEFCFV